MNQYITGMMIRKLREEKGMTQAELAEKLFVSDKAVSKWENGKGYPDISLLESVAKVFDVSAAELMTGKAVSNVNQSANMLRSKFYVCPVCGNVVHSMGEAVIHCHGVLLAPAQEAETDERHMIFIEGAEDEYYVRIEHEMTKEHYISFAAALSQDGIQMIRLYPEGGAAVRLKAKGVSKICFCCSRDGMFSAEVHPGIDGRQSAYDDTEERRALEQAAKMLFG